MSVDTISYYILLSALVNATALGFSAYLMYGIYRIPFYHIMSFYLLYFFLGFVVRPFEIWLQGNSQSWDIIGAVPSGDTILWATAMALVGHAVMLAGFAVHHREFKPIPTLAPINMRAGRPAVYALATVFFLLAGVYGNLSAFTTDPGGPVYDARGAIQLTNVSGYQTVLAELMPVALTALFAVRRTRKISIALIAGYVVYRMSAGGARSGFVSLLISIGSIWLVNARRRFPSPRLLAGGVVLLLVFNIIGSNRTAFADVLSGEKTLSEVYQNYVEYDSGAGITQNMQEFDIFTSLLSHIPDESGYSFGTQYIRVLIWPIPRFWWPDKPIFTSIVDLLDYGNYTNFSYTMFFDAYESLGLASLIIVVFLSSFYVNGLYKALTQRPTALRTFTYFIHLSYCFLLFRDGIGVVSYFYITLSFGALILSRVSALQLVRNDGHYPGTLQRSRIAPDPQAAIESRLRRV